jgi:hypothetical protein
MEININFKVSTEDVRKVIANRNIRFKGGRLTDEECVAVLEKAKRTWTLEEGINSDVIEYWIYTLYRARIVSLRDSRYGYHKFTTK